MGMVKIILSGEIGWGIWPRDIQRQLNSANGKDLDIRIASPGGYVDDGIEIYNMIRDYKRDFPKSQIMMTIKGLAASMASYLVSNPAIDLRVAEDNAVFMIHNAWGYAVGDYKEMIKNAKILEGFTNILGEAYSKSAEKPLKEIRTLMDEETWYFGGDILKFGFVDEMTPDDEFKGEKVTKDKAISNAKTSFAKLKKEIRGRDKKTDFEKIAAAIIGTDKSQAVEPPAEKPTLTIVPKNNTNQPASAGNNNISEGNFMDFEKLMNENPAAKFEYEKKEKAKFEAGKKEGIEIGNAKMKAVAKYLAPGSTYGKGIQNAAIDVLNGEKEADYLEMLATSIEAMKEENISSVAQTETAALPNVTGLDPKLTQDGEISSDADFNAEVERSNSLYGGA